MGANGWLFSSLALGSHSKPPLENPKEMAKKSLSPIQSVAKAISLSVTRHALTGLGATLVAQGVLTESCAAGLQGCYDVQSLLGAGLFVVTVAWGAFDKWQTDKRAKALLAP